MEELFVLLFLASLVMLVSGLIKPAILSRLLKGSLSRKNIAFAFGGFALLMLFLIGIFAPASTKIEPKVTSTPKVLVSTTSAIIALNDEETSLPTFRAFTPAQVNQIKIQTDTLTPSSYCHSGDPLANVYNPSRLQVISNCIEASGIVDAVRKEADGDYHINIKLDSQYANLINDKNVSGENGDLVTEIVCANSISQSDAVGACVNYNNEISAPSIGSHVYVIGPYVLDRSHGWMEIHPVWHIGTSAVGNMTTSVPTQTQKTYVVPQPTSSTTTQNNTGGATGLCNDGTETYAVHHQGACSHHGGVARWY